MAALDNDPASYDYAVTRTHLTILNAATDAKGRKLQVVTLTAPTNFRKTYYNDDFAAGYVNFYVCNNAIIMPEFGDSGADSAARNQLQSLFPGRTIEQVNIDGIAAGGGGIHCATQQEPRG